MEHEEKEIGRVLIQGFVYSATFMDAFLVFAILLYRRLDSTLLLCAVSAEVLFSFVEIEGFLLAADADTETG